MWKAGIEGIICITVRTLLFILHEMKSFEQKVTRFAWLKSNILDQSGP